MWLSTGVVLLATLFVLYRLRPMSDLISEPLPGPRVRRLVISRGLFAVGVWEWSIALVLLVGGANVALWIANLAVGAYLVWGSRHLWAFGMMGAHDRH